MEAGSPPPANSQHTRLSAVNHTILTSATLSLQTANTGVQLSPTVRLITPVVSSVLKVINTFVETFYY